MRGEGGVERFVTHALHTSHRASGETVVPRDLRGGTRVREAAVDSNLLGEAARLAPGWRGARNERGYVQAPTETCGRSARLLDEKESWAGYWCVKAILRLCVRQSNHAVQRWMKFMSLLTVDRTNEHRIRLDADR